MSVEAVETVVAPEAVAAPEVVTEQTAAVAEVSPAVAAKIVKQLEFYFGDANLPRDKFLQEKLKESEAGWIPLAVLATFARMKVLSEDAGVIAEAVAQSGSELLEVSEDRTQVRRKTELPEAQDNLTTSVYAKGFPLTASLDDIEAFFGGAFDGKVLAIRMRRQLKTKEFKGSVFVELASAEEAERLAGLSLSLPGASEPLTMHTKAKYFELKNAERTAKAKPAEEERPLEYTKGCLLLVEAVPEGVTFEQIKTAVGASRPVAFADIDAARLATIRFKEALPEGETLPEDVATIKVEGHELAPRRPTEEEEKAYYEAFFQSLRAKAKQRGGPRNRGGRPAKRQRN